MIEIVGGVPRFARAEVCYEVALGHDERRSVGLIAIGNVSLHAIHRLIASVAALSTAPRQVDSLVPPVCQPPVFDKVLLDPSPVVVRVDDIATRLDKLGHAHCQDRRHRP